jgi:hypothetical protein
MPTEKTIRRHVSSFSGCENVACRPGKGRQGVLVQRKVDGLGCKTGEEFKAAVLHSPANLPKEELYNLFRSMKAEVRKCLDTNGGKTRYCY